MTTRTLRVDAERNRAQILAAAGAAYAKAGTDISLDEVARLAGVGVGTVYRRFPTKDALIDALFEKRMTEYAEHAEAARTLAATEPWKAFRQHLEYLAEQQALDLGFSEILRDPNRGSEAFRALHRRALRASLGLVRTAKQAGVLRSDFMHSDLLLGHDAIHGIVASRRGNPRVAARRFAALLLDAFRQS
jgi:AcrR family transcriptional regulator